MNRKKDGTIEVVKSDVENLLNEIKTAPKWKIKKWAEEHRKFKKRIGLK